MASFKPISRKKASEQVADQIRKSILGGGLRPGQRLPSERDLASQFEVTRTTLREALKRLESLKLIFIRHGDRATVLDWMRHGSLELLNDLISRKDRLNVALLENVMEARVVVGAEVARLAARRRGDDDLLNLEEAFETLEHAKGEVREFQAAEFDFFHALATTSHNLVFVFLLNSMRKLYVNNGTYFAPLVGDQEATVANHRTILDAIRRQDGEVAARQSRTFLEEGMERIISARAGADDEPQP
jgi:GntR family transcriptional regulator, transcriptional repressor for pyruvate dehydrogenase complex